MITMKGNGGAVFAYGGKSYVAQNGMLSIPEALEGLAQQHGFRKLSGPELAELSDARAAEPATQVIAPPEEHPQTADTEKQEERTKKQAEARAKAADAETVGA